MNNFVIMVIKNKIENGNLTCKELREKIKNIIQNGEIK